MDFLQPEWDQDKPSPSDAQALLVALEIEPAPFSAPAIDELLDSLRATHANGGALFARWRLPADRTLHWYASRNRLDEIPFFPAFLSSAPVRAALPELRTPSHTLHRLKLEWGNPFALDGEIARAVYVGGAYTSPFGDPREAKRIGVAFCDALFGQRYDEVEVYRTYQPWSPWFHDVAWDVTWLGIDKRDRSAWLLCATDTD